MSADVSTVEPHGGSEQSVPVRGRRVLVGTAVVVVLVVLVALWWSQSTPQLVEGSQVGPDHGSEQVSDTDAFAEPGALIWRQTAPEAWAAWSVRNDGRYAVTLSQAPPTAAGPNVMPRRTLRFLAARPDGGSPEGLSGAAPTGLVDSLTIGPGEEGFLVAEVFFPEQCLAVHVSSTQPVMTYEWRVATVDARVLGRTTAIDVPLPNRFDTPTLEGACPLEAFGGR